MSLLDLTSRTMMGKMFFLFLLIANVQALRLLQDNQGIDGSKKTELIVVRVTHELAPGINARLHQFAEDVKENLPNAHFLVSVDETNGTLITDLPEENIHRYTWQSLLDSYPVLETAAKDFQKGASWVIKNRPGFNKLHVPPLRTYHAEPILAAFESAKKNNLIANDAKVWSVESDVFVCGKLSSFIKEYANDESDLLGSGPFKRFYPVKNGGNKAFHKKYPISNGKVKVEEEHVQRFSAKFMEMIRHSSQDLKVNAHSEIYVPTLCHNDPNCKYGEFKAKNLGDYVWSTQHTKEEVDKICSETTETTINHAAKWKEYGEETPEAQ